jgi:PAS domain S-box-containing protein
MMKKGKKSTAEELRQFIETANAPIFGIDSNGLVNEWNQASEKITGFKKNEVLGQDLVEIYITEDYRKAVKRVLDNALKGEETANFEFPLFSKDGNRVMVLLNSSTRKNANGDIVGVLGVGQDITILNAYKENLESKVKDRTQELAFEDREKDKRAAELVIANKELAFQNNEKEKRASELSIANIELAFQNEEKDKRANELAITNKELAFQIEEKDKRANELAIANKELALQDREKEKRAQELEESLLREQELGLLKSNFVSMASHEFRTPLTSISATSDVILRYFDRLSREDINKRLEKIKREVDDMTIMLEDILIIGRSDAQKLDYKPDFLDIVDLIKNIIYEYQLSESKKRKIIYDLPLPVIIAKVDRKWIKHIVINLFTNAIKYSNEDTQIEISIKREPSGVSFSFRDYGVGISKEDISRLFEPFYRGSNVAGISGTGLGLIVLQKALELHNGKIEIASKIGEGSNFKVILPTGEPLQ